MTNSVKKFNQFTTYLVQHFLPYSHMAPPIK
ncbi:hypothetical protein BVI434_410052 [Burkholderia vietnamiensis]|nr:hypothetical protein BVI434_410052 [Burkholderia vietnamiensis]